MHFAAWLSVGDSVRDPAGYYRNNVLGALSVLDAMVAEQVSSLVFSSTAAVFGNPVETPITETHPTVPINAYGETKLAIERALPHYERAYGIRAVVLRYFNASGADPDGELGEDHSPELHLIPRAIDAALGRDTFQIFGDDYDTPDGTCLRDYVHVTDLAEAHVLAMDSLCSGGPSATYNLGNGRPTSVREVVDSVARVTGTPVPLTVGPRRDGDPAQSVCVERRASGSELGWKPRYEDVDTIVGTAWAWRKGPAVRISHCRRRGTLMSRLKGQLTDPLLSVVMPAYNEEATIEEIIRRVLAVPIRTQLIVVDDGSKDRTREILTRLAAELPIQGHLPASERR